MVKFSKIRWKNFLSTGNSWTEIDFLKSPTTIILGKNGAGKSTILDALCFALFGKPYRKINKPQLMNSINQGACVVELEFSVGKKVYKIIRGMKPNVFEIICDGALINQDAKAKDYQEHLEKYILKFNFKSFTQVVILGTASFVPFMQLVAADRRTIIEELLDIGIFSSMNVVTKNRLTDVKELQRDNDYEIRLNVEKINLQIANIEESRKNSEERIKEKQQEISLNREHIERLEEEIAQFNACVTNLYVTVDSLQSITAKSRKLLQIESKFEDNIKKIRREIQFYQDHDNCPTCNQTIAQDHKDKSITDRNAKLAEIQEATLKLAGEIAKINQKAEELATVEREISSHSSETVKLQSQVNSIRSYIQRIEADIEAIRARAVDMEANNTKLKELREVSVKLAEDAESLTTTKVYLEYAATLLKDTGIKTKIIKQYLPIMNKMINKYLASLDFFVNFNLNESFEETIKSRHRDEFSYASFSEGEKQKIDMALLFTWRQVAKIKNSTSSNLLILDEIFDGSLDPGSVDLLMNMLKANNTDTNIFVISHKPDQMIDKFDQVIKFTKKGNFSVIEK